MLELFTITMLLQNLCMFALLAQFVHTELFTAMVDLQRALHAEQDIAEKLKSYITQEEDRLKQLKR